MAEKPKIREVKETIVRDMRRAGYTTKQAETKATEVMRSIDRKKRGQ